MQKNDLISRFRNEGLNFDIMLIYSPRSAGLGLLLSEIESLYQEDGCCIIDLSGPIGWEASENPLFFLSNLSEDVIFIKNIQKCGDFCQVFSEQCKSNVFNKSGPLLGKKIIISADMPFAYLIISLFNESKCIFKSERYFGISVFDKTGSNDDYARELWLKGSYARSFNISNEQKSLRLRQQIISDSVQGLLKGRDLQLIRLLRALAANQGQPLNSSLLSGMLDVSHVTVRAWVDTLETAGLVHIVNPMSPKNNKRVFKTPRVYVADTGLLHGLLNIRNINQLMEHPVYLESWKTFVLKEILSLGDVNLMGFYRTSYGTGIDFIFEFNGLRVGISANFKMSLKKIKGQQTAIESMNIDRSATIVPGALSSDDFFIPLSDLRSFFYKKKANVNKLKRKPRKIKEKVESPLTEDEIRQISLFNI